MVTLAACKNSSNDPGATGAPSTGGAQSGTRTVETPRGPVEVPADPQRIACLVGSADIDVMAFGLDPVYSSDFAAGWVDLPETTKISNAIPPEVEVVAATSPDLMIGWDWMADEPAWKQFEKIAPAVTLPEEYSTPDYWRLVFTTLADYVNRSDEGAGLLADYDARVAELAGAATERELPVSHINVYEPGVVDWYGYDYDSTAILQSVGIEYDGPEKTKYAFSWESLDDVTAPTVLLGVQDPDAATEMTSGPIWPTLPAVQAGQVLELDAPLWAGYGLIWANALLDDIEEMFFA